ncbi:MAG: cytochrome c-type biogenesis protein CcmH [Bryobacteraceae bacterium]|nr:cytochrome c-type biogenesis protein CcmH [Bryobacteraceae bacterium]
MLSPRLFFWAAVMCAIAAAEPASTSANPERASALSNRILAPCCWRESVSVHRSPVADSVRQQITAAVSSGKSNEEIIEALVEEHGRRILREPGGSQGTWLYTIPVVGVLIAGACLVQFLKHSVSRPPMATVSPLCSGNPAIDDFPDED